MLSSYELSLILGMEQRLGFPELSIVDCIMFETGGTFSPRIRNKQSGAVGLIQFLESSAEELEKGLYKRLPDMSVPEQLVYVEKYFQFWKKVFPAVPNEAFDVYCLLLHPVLYNKPLETVFGQDGQKRYIQNKGFDIDLNGVITKSEIRKKWLSGVANLKVSKPLPIVNIMGARTRDFLAIGAILTLVAIYYVLKMQK